MMTDLMKMKEKSACTMYNLLYKNNFYTIIGKDFQLENVNLLKYHFLPAFW